MNERLVLFDIDGTLMVTRGAGSRCLLAAGRAVFGEAFAWSDSAVRVGELDPQIYAALASANGVDDPERHHERFRDVYLRLLAEELKRVRGEIRVMPGVGALLGALDAREGVTVGLLSGNYAQAASLKLEAAGIGMEPFAVRALGEDAADRAGLVEVALERYRGLRGRSLEAGQVVVVGDTPRDVACARAHGARMLAVGTGRYSVAELEQAGAEVAMADLSDTERVLAWLELGGGRAMAQEGQRYGG